jgi:hypothetical protein
MHIFWLLRKMATSEVGYIHYPGLKKMEEYKDLLVPQTQHIQELGYSSLVLVPGLYYLGGPLDDPLQEWLLQVPLTYAANYQSWYHQ